ncbi:hypothetical protein [Glutamicibacter sp. NPDC087344]|uniref:hypothetical protein n=1 Tax=Glutamicibacter sp. NPDC087344 TaxID=3363994 RepID=UPI003819F347
MTLSYPPSRLLRHLQHLWDIIGSEADCFGDSETVKPVRLYPSSAAISGSHWFRMPIGGFRLRVARRLGGKISALVLYLASDESRFVSGSSIAIDGGETAGNNLRNDS